MKTKQEIIQKFQVNAKDTGSPEVQIALMTERIRVIADHVKTHAKDFHCRRGLMNSIGRRKSLLHYLKRKNPERYTTIIKELGLRH